MDCSKIFSADMPRILGRVYARLQNNPLCIELFLCLSRHLEKKEVSLHFHTLLEEILACLPYESILRKQVISFGDDQMVCWLCKHIHAILHTHLPHEASEIFFCKSIPQTLQKIILLFEKNINAYVKIYVLFEKIKSHCSDISPEVFNSIRDECMCARTAYLHTGKLLYKKMRKAEQEYSLGACKYLMPLRCLSIQELYEEMGEEYLFDYVERLLKTLAGIKWPTVSHAERRAIDIFYTIYSEHWESLLRSEIFIEKSLPCEYLFRRISEFDVNNRRSVCIAQEILMEYAQRRDSLAAYLAEEKPLHHLSQAISIQDTKDFSQISVKRKINALLSYCGRQPQETSLLYRMALGVETKYLAVACATVAVIGVCLLAGKETVMGTLAKIFEILAGLTVSARIAQRNKAASAF